MELNIKRDYDAQKLERLELSTIHNVKNTFKGIVFNKREFKGNGWTFLGKNTEGI